MPDREILLQQAREKLLCQVFGIRRLVSATTRSEEHTSELQSRLHLVCRLLLEKKKHASRRHLQIRERPPPHPGPPFNLTQTPVAAMLRLPPLLQRAVLSRSLNADGSRTS